MSAAQRLWQPSSGPLRGTTQGYSHGIPRHHCSAHPGRPHVGVALHYFFLLGSAFTAAATAPARIATAAIMAGICSAAHSDSFVIVSATDSMEVSR